MWLLISIIGLTTLSLMVEPARAETAAANQSVTISEQSPQPDDGIENKPFITGDDPLTGAGGKPERGSTGLGLWTYAALGLVLLLILGAAVVFRKAYPGMRMFSSLSMVQVLGRAHLSPKQTLAMVKIDQQVVIVGVTEHTITNVLTISDPERVADLVAQIEQQRAGSVTGTFAQLFAGERKGFKNESLAPSPTETPTEALEENDETSVFRLKTQLNSLINKVNRLKGTGGRH